MTYLTVSIGIRHRDCWHYKISTALNATIAIKYLYMLPNGQLYSGQTITCQHAEEVEPLLRQVPEVRKFLILSQSHGKTEVITWAEQSSIMESITKANCVFVGQVVVREGVENWHIIAPTQEDLQKAIDSLERYADIAYIRHGYVPIDESGLTERQSAALQAAAESGYFDTPRKGSIKDVAERMHVSTSTASEHLRKAEKKVMKEYVQGSMKFLFTL
jgi:predicted DNA binding protein